MKKINVKVTFFLSLIAVVLLTAGILCGREVWLYEHPEIRITFSCDKRENIYRSYPFCVIRGRSHIGQGYAVRYDEEIQQFRDATGEVFQWINEKYDSPLSVSSDVTIGEGKTVITFWGTGKSIETGEMEEINRDCVLEYELDAEVLHLEETPELVENVWDPKESVVCGDTEPKVTGAFGTNITWKQLNLNMNFSYRLGGQVYNQTLINRVENADPRDNVDRRVLEQRWQKPGDHTFYKDINDKSTTPASSRFIQDENVLQLGSLSLSYDLKKEWLKPIGFDMVRLTAMMNDVFRLSTVKRERGISYPFARSMSLGVMVQF